MMDTSILVVISLRYGYIFTHIYVASIDVVTLTVIVTRNRSQGYTVVIICIKKMKHQPIKSLYLTVVSVELYSDLLIGWTITRRNLELGLRVHEAWISFSLVLVQYLIR